MHASRRWGLECVTTFGRRRQLIEFRISGEREGKSRRKLKTWVAGGDFSGPPLDSTGDAQSLSSSHSDCPTQSRAVLCSWSRANAFSKSLVERPAGCFPSHLKYLHMYISRIIWGPQRARRASWFRESRIASARESLGALRLLLHKIWIYSVP